MGLYLWTREDLQNTLTALYLASIASEPEVRSSHEYEFRRGFVAALEAVGANFGISLPLSPSVGSKGGWQVGQVPAVRQASDGNNLDSEP
jgi:hypothetical protein